MKKLTKSDINQKVDKLFNQSIKIDWAEDYTSRKQKVTAIHNVFGPFKISIDKLLSGQNHPIAKAIKFSNKEEINKTVLSVHKNKVHIDWSKTKFPLLLKDYVYAIDVDYGPWKIRLQNLINGQKHKKRFLNSKKLNKTIIDKKVKDIYKGTVFIKWKEDYKNNKQIVTAIDSEFGEWQVPIYKLLLGVKNKKRTDYEQSLSKKLSIEEINSIVKNIHEDVVYIDWESSSNYQGNDSYVIAVDKDFGPWPIKVKNLLRGQGHKDRFLNKIKLKKEDIDSRISEIFNDTVCINWTKTGPYINNSSKVIAFNLKAGEWETSVSKLLQGHNHPSLGSSSSKGEEEIFNWLKSLGLSVTQRKVFKINNQNYEVDIFLEDFNLGIEYNGIYFHSEIFKKPKDHLIKREVLETLNIKLFQFLESEWLEKKEIVKSIILSKINHVSIKKFNARELTVTKVTKKDAQLFLKENHLMGEYLPASYYALITKNLEIVSLIGIQNQKNHLEISRFCNKKLTSVRGGFSKLLSFLEKKYSPSKILSFVDLRTGTGSSLIVNGFKLESISLGWNWTNFKKVFNRRYCRANMDKRKLSEKEYAEELGLVRIYDAGQAKFIKNL